MVELSDVITRRMRELSGYPGKSITNTDAARRCDIHYNDFLLLRGGKRRDPSRAVLRKLCRGLGIDPAEAIGFGESEPGDKMES